KSIPIKTLIFIAKVGMMQYFLTQYRDKSGDGDFWKSDFFKNHRVFQWPRSLSVGREVSLLGEPAVSHPSLYSHRSLAPYVPIIPQRLL
ncbi:hypothetical protein, partial [Bacillus sp. AFS041924]|uniref:hypothetical protein n=1 Tax=Bacillus sp. AFS041924 TaxID=2033503 RepID=UPI000C024A7A